jgi:hypothetical protein
MHLQFGMAAIKVTYYHHYSSIQLCNYFYEDYRKSGVAEYELDTYESGYASHDILLVENIANKNKNILNVGMEIGQK